MNGGGNPGTFIMNSGIIAIDSGNNNKAGLTLTDLGSGPNTWQGGQIKDSLSSNNYVELNSVNKTSTLNVGNSVVNTGTSSLLADMHIDGSSNGKAQLILDS